MKLPERNSSDVDRAILSRNGTIDQSKQSSVEDTVPTARRTFQASAGLDDTVTVTRRS